MSAQAKPFDLLVIGGGINGVGIARDAAGRGLSVVLVEQHDLAAHTSSASTKLIHGGLRYLEHGEFRLVREALIEREILLGVAPHLIRPLEFILPHAPHLRSMLTIRAGLFLYDHLSKRRRLAASRALSLRTHPTGAALREEYSRGFSYMDCRVDDSRLAALNAVDAAARGALVLPRTKLHSARPEGGLWRAETDAGVFAARAIVNASGPWVAETLGRRLRLAPRNHLRLVKGSHIVVPRLHEGAAAFILQNSDGRIVFVIPYEQRFSLIGTTDVAYEGDPAQAKVSVEETLYLCESVNRYLRRRASPDAVVWSYAGVRPLFDDAAENAQSVTRDYALELESEASRPPVLSVFGGKITTYRKLAEHALGKVIPAIGAAARAPWTDEAPLPGGEFADFDQFLADFQARHVDLAPAAARRLAQAYGTRAERFVGKGAGADLGGGLSEAELDYLVREEWAREPEDVLWRRSKLGLHLSRAEASNVADWLARRAVALAPARPSRS
jgi:glycerol-3-phosphate dehydrogenase